MRTTLTLEADVERLLEEQMHRARQPLKQVVNEALRRGLTRNSVPKEKFVVFPHVAVLAAGVDPTSFNALADELEDTAIISTQGQRIQARLAKGRQRMPRRDAKQRR